MASGREHISSGVTLGLALLAGPIPISGAACVVGALMCNPDLDLKQSLPSQNWGFFKAYWWPYHKLVPHRHWVSHSLLISTAIRFAYCLPIWYLLGLSNEQMLYVYLGLAINDALHLFMDGMLP